MYESENALEAFELELDRALEAGCNVIVIEPTRLADETAQWIAFGNFLHRTAVFSGVGAIFAGTIAFNITLCLKIVKKYMDVSELIKKLRLKM